VVARCDDPLTFIPAPVIAATSSIGAGPPGAPMANAKLVVSAPTTHVLAL
jgi:hypothetical protein